MSRSPRRLLIRFAQLPPSISATIRSSLQNGKRLSHQTRLLLHESFLRGMAVLRRKLKGLVTGVVLRFILQRSPTRVQLLRYHGGEVMT